MTGWNLPPGVNVNDIPGNRPEDEAYEVFWEKLDEEFQSRYGKKAIETIDSILASPNLDGPFINYVDLAAELAAIHAVSDYKADQELEHSYAEERLDIENAKMQTEYMKRLEE